MASTALLFSFSAVVFLVVLLQAPPAPGFAVADLLASALDRFFLDGRGLMELATRRNMILLCHAILLLILRDAGVLGAPARRCRSRTPPGEAATATTVVVALAQTADPAPARAHATRSAVVAQAACSAVPVPVPVPARTHATRSAVVWRRRRPRNRAVVAPVDEHDAAGRVIAYQPAVEVAATWAAPLLATGPAAVQPEEAGALAAKQIVLVESPTPRNDDDDLLDRHDRAAVVEPPLEHPTAIAAGNGERDDCDDDRRIIAVADDDDTARDPAGMEMELADDRTFEEFIESQRRQMRQESLRLQLVRSDYANQAIATCY